jgi:hypothetical protein
MSSISQQLLDSFEKLPESEKQQVAYEILRRSLIFVTSPLTDEELIFNAEELFLNLDSEEIQDEQ